MLTLQFIPYSDIASLTSENRIKKLLDIVKEEKIILLEGRLQEKEETELIKKTMENINEKFTGIELSTIYPYGKDAGISKRLREMLLRLLLGNRGGLTIIGPASVIKEIKKDPNKIELFTRDSGDKKK